MSAATVPSAATTSGAKTEADVWQTWIGSPVRAATTYARSAIADAGIGSAGVAALETAGFTNYALRVLLFSLLYVFIVFLILLIVHYSIRPVFSFVPGGTGFISVPTATDDKIYWTDKKQPPADSRVPADTDTLAQYAFDNNFTVSVDLYIRRPTDTAEGHRVVFYKTYRSGPGTGIKQPTGVSTEDIVNPVTALAPTSTTDLLTQMARLTSMMAYLDGNDLYVIMFTGPTHTQLSTPAIKNIPVYEPFRLSVIVEAKLFTVYINEKQVFQRVFGGPDSTATLLRNTYSPVPAATTTEFFYSPPTWTETPMKTIFVQNFHLWPRAITYSELKAAQPSLAAEADFNLPVESGSSSCS